MRTRRRLVVGVVGSVLAAAALGGCNHPALPRITLPKAAGTANCYQGLPTAAAVLNAPSGSYHFVGLKRASARQVLRAFPHAPLLGADPSLVVCTYAFTGTFPPGQVTGATSRRVGKASVVIMTTDRQFIASFVLSRLPEHFRHLAHA